jgi:hypothetical protein
LMIWKVTCISKHKKYSSLEITCVTELIKWSCIANECYFQWFCIISIHRRFYLTKMVSLMK